MLIQQVERWVKHFPQRNFLQSLQPASPHTCVLFERSCAHVSPVLYKLLSAIHRIESEFALHVDDPKVILLLHNLVVCVTHFQIGVKTPT